MNVIGDFIGNVAGHYGAIYIERCNLSIKGNFIRNNVTWNGGVGYISKTNATMIGDFINNTARMMFSLFINEIGSNTTIIGNFMNNTAERFGIANKGYINVKGNFTNNIANYGGALFNAGNCSIVGNFTNNIADYGGALFNAGNCSIVGNFTNNIADYGGALYNSGNMVIQGDFINNTANEYGGAIFADGNLNCSYGIFYRNFANNTNSTVFIYSGNVDLSYNFWGCNNPNFTDLINSSNNYTMDNFFQVLLKCDVMNSTLTIGDKLHYYVDLKLNTSDPFDLGKLSPINVNLRDNVNAILDEFIVQNNTAPNSRNTTVNNDLNYYNLYFYDNLLDVLIYKTKIRSLVSVNVENGFYNTTLKANVTLCNVNGNNLTDDVIVTINGVNYTVNVVNGHAYFNISGLDSGNYSVTVIYNGNGNITGSSNITSFEVFKIDSIIIISVPDAYYNTVITGNVTLVDINGNKLSENVNVTIHSDIKNFNVNVINGVGYFNITGLNSGLHEANVSYGGNNNINSSKNSITFKVLKIHPNLTINVGDVDYNKPVNVNVKLTDEFGNKLNGTAIITVGGTNYNVNVVNGIGTLRINNLYIGKYDVTARFEGNENIYSSNATNSFKVKLVKTNIWIKKIAQNKSVKVNDLVVFVVTVGNDGPLFHDVSVKEVLINGLNLISAKASKGAFNSKKAIWNIGDLRHGETAKLILTFRVSAPGTYTNVVAVNINGSSVNVTTNESVNVESNNKKHSDSKSVEKIEKTSIEPATGNPVLLVLLALISVFVPKILNFKK